MTEVLRIPTSRKILPVEFEMGDGTVRKLELREMTGKQRDEYLNLARKKQDQKEGTIVDFRGINADLLAKTLWDVETEKYVPLTDIENYPSSVQVALFQAAQDMHQPKKEGEEGER